MKLRELGFGILTFGSCAFCWLVVESKEGNGFMLEILLGLFGIRILFEEGE